MKYLRLCKGLNSIGQLVPHNTNIYKFINDMSKDWYSSLYYYNEDQYKQTEEIIQSGDTKRKRGVSGITNVETDRLVFDFDSETDLTIAKKESIELCNKLIKYGINPENIRICFSGKKGFTIELVTHQTYKPDEFKNIVFSLAGEYSSFDTVVNNASRVIRIPYTKHQDSGYYKIPLTFDELQTLSIDEIRSIAKEESEIGFPEGWVKFTLPDTIYDLRNSKIDVVVEANIPQEKCNLDLSKNKLNLSPWKYALLNGYFPNGTRSHALMILASTFRNLGMDMEACYGMLKGVVRLQQQRFGGTKFTKEEIYKTVIDQVYDELWRGGCYSEDHFSPELQQYLLSIGIERGDKKDTEDAGFVNMDDIFNIFDDFATNIDKNSIKTGIEPLDKLAKLRTSMLVGVLGAPSSGKTSVALEVLRHTSLQNEESIFFSLDMGAPLIYTKLAQKVSGYNQDRLFELFKNRDDEAIGRIRYKINQNYQHMTVSFKTALSVADIRQSVKAHEEKTGKKVRVIVIDYLECINLPTSDVNTGISLISQQLKDIANDLRVCVLLLLQPPKRVGDPSQPILSYTDIKGASTVAQACSIVISLYREGFSPKSVEDDRFISFAIIKNRLGQLGQIDCSWDGLTGDIGELDDVERNALEELRREKKEQKVIEDL